MQIVAHRQVNYKAMRIVVGVIALLLSPIVYYLSGEGPDLASISASYWTDARDIFVGSLVAVGFFLATYNGSGKTRDSEYYLSKAACVFAGLVAIFPTKGGTPAKWVNHIADAVWLCTGQIHYASAVLLFICLMALMWFFSIRARLKGSEVRSLMYRAISIAMGVGMALIYLVGEYVLVRRDTVFWVEVWGLTLFGIGWLRAGTYKSKE